jgi:hypothetical protein
MRWSLMAKHIIRGLAVAATILLVGCSGDSPTAPTAPGSAAPAADGESFEVTGIVTDDQGRPLAGIPVTMRHYTAGKLQAPTTVTDAAGAYLLAFIANPWNSPSGRGAARAELVTDTYEWYYRTVFASGPHLVENFRLHPLQLVVSGDSAQLTIAADDGECIAGLSWTLAKVCRTIALIPQANGSISVEAISQGDAGQPLMSVCCVGGDDRYGNPLTIPVSAELRFTVEIGLTGELTTPQPIVVRVSFTSS